MEAACTNLGRASQMVISEEAAVFTKILVPTDGSPHAMRAAEYAADLAKQYGAEVLVLIATNFQLIENSPASVEAKNTIREAIREANAETLSKVAQKFIRAGVKVMTKELEGPPAFVIDHVVAEGNFDLVVMGSRGLGLPPEERAFIGSVTDSVLRLVKCPVLVVKEG
jgi:nucleotide-binding universal stress UspA family protein